MAQTYLELFKDQFYPEIFKEAAEATILSFGEEEAGIAESWKRELGRYLEEVAALQQKGQIGAVSEITISFLYTSLYEGEAAFRVDSYGEEGRVYGESLARTTLPGRWLVRKLSDFRKKLADCAAREGLRSYVRPAALDVLTLRAVRSLLWYFAGRFKYLIAKVLDERALGRLDKGEVFVIRIGEYMDWQNTVYAILPEVDIFNCGSETKLQFRRFPAIVYREKQFRSLNLCQAKFTDCTFEDVVIEGCCMNDCTFDGCSFGRVSVRDTQMAGSVFLDCSIRETVFENIVFCGEGVEGHEAECFAPAGFVGCTLQSVCFDGCRLGGAEAVDCEAEDVRVRSCDAPGADFLKMEGGENVDGVL